ncbi:MAG: hypothetical protein ORN27_00195 [Rhodoluna sp.]|nr:hypothetical protein [Rhodoluna sp.]
MSKPNLEILATSILTPCKEPASAGCIEKLELAKPDGEFTEAQFDHTALGGHPHTADAKLNLLEGGGGSIFYAPGVPSASGTTEYAVVIKAGQIFDHGSGKFLSPNGLHAMVVPVRDEANSGYNSEGGPNSNMCVYFEVGHCGIAQDFAEGTQVRLTFRAPKGLGGWFRGRINHPAITVESANTSANRITMEGQSTVVPRFAYVQETASLTADEKSYLSHLSNWGAKAGTTYGLGGSEQGSPEFIEHYRKPLGDTATGLSSFWSMNTAQTGGGSGCLSDTSQVLGIVTTNSMAYDPNAPSFVNGALDYKVSGLHWMPGGKYEVQGTYDLVMRSETARCLYGFSKAPISAKISVTSSTGEAKVATTVMSEKAGWVKLAAYGFNYSSPTVSVKLTQEGRAPSKKTTITCVKGKLTKKVTGVGTKCPAGYKKKQETL